MDVGRKLANNAHVSAPTRRRVAIHLVQGDTDYPAPCLTGPLTVNRIHTVGGCAADGTDVVETPANSCCFPYVLSYVFAGTVYLSLSVDSVSFQFSQLFSVQRGYKIA